MNAPVFYFEKSLKYVMINLITIKLIHKNMSFKFNKVFTFFLILVMAVFTANFFILAWSEPDDSPPGGSPAGLAWQSDANGIYYDAGNIGIGAAPSASNELNIAGTVEANVFLYSSDKNLKHNVKELDNSLEKIQQLRGVDFEWNGDDSRKKNIGLIAQDVEKVYPELVNTDPETGLKSVQYGNLVAPLIEAVKEQQRQIDALEKQIEELKK